MIVHEIDWDQASIQHIARHGVDPKEVEDVCFGPLPLIMKTKHNRYFALGQTESGRYLTIILEYIGRHRIKIITARSMSMSERRLYRR